MGNLQTADTVMEEASPESRFSWIKSSTKCGLRTGQVDTGVAGNWKCHLGKIASLICNLIFIFSNTNNKVKLKGSFKYYTFTILLIDTDKFPYGQYDIKY